MVLSRRYQVEVLGRDVEAKSLITELLSDITERDTTIAQLRLENETLKHQLEKKDTVDQASQYEIEQGSLPISTDPWDEYKFVFNLDRKFIKTERADIVNVIVKLTSVNKDAGIDRFKLINAVTSYQLRDGHYKSKVSSLISEILCDGIPDDNIIRGIELK